MSQKFKAIIRKYKQDKQQNPDTWIQHCQNQNNLSDAIHFAAYSKNIHDKKHPHQHRLKMKNLQSFEKKILAVQKQIATTKDFDTLYSIIEECRTDGIGDLAIYDTAIRIGAYLGLTPGKIYLHAGTKIGAAKLIKKVNTSTINKTDLPDPFKNSDLSCYELEDMLCIFKDKF